MQTWFLNRYSAAKYLREEYGILCSEKSLAELAESGRGPRCVIDDDSVWYTNDTLDTWVGPRLNVALAASNDAEAETTMKKLSVRLLDKQLLEVGDTKTAARRITIIDINPISSQTVRNNEVEGTK